MSRAMWRARRKPGIRHREDEPGDQADQAAGGYGIQQLQTLPAGSDRSLSMKWDGEWHITVEVFRDLGPGLRRRAGSDLRAGGRMVPVVHHAAGDHGADPADARWDPAGACADGRILYRDFDDWLYCRRGHHRAQFHHPGGLHRAAPSQGMALEKAWSMPAPCVSVPCC